MASRWKRIVVGPNEDGRSAVLDTEQTNVQSKEGFYWRATLWGTRETPADNTIEGDRSLDVKTREPFPNGMLCRALEIPPDHGDAEAHLRVFNELNEQIGHTIEATAEDSARHPTMHRTDTLDCITCVIGEIYLVTDVEEVLMKPGDTVIIRGTNHGWSNRSDEPCLLVGTMLDAVPKSPRIAGGLR
ncbi:MAG: cupin domain-containing protein [Hamadaea sp.]|nr:cupin domain-containing protein [Hamadaea sp.]NUR98148.1 cupin domain-containing protein [Kribbellaceae bacterium]